MRVLGHSRTHSGRSGAEPTKIAVKLGPGTEWLQASLQTCLGAGFAVTAGLGGNLDELVILTADDPSRVEEFAGAHPEASVVAVAYGGDADPATSAELLDGGAQGYLSVDSVPVLAAYLRAISRRHPPQPSGRAANP